MSEDRRYVEGELYLSLRTVAEVYRIQVTWLHEAYASGLFGRGLGRGRDACIAAVQMDRVSTVVRMHEVLGLDLETIRLVLDDAFPHA